MKQAIVCILIFMVLILSCTVPVKKVNVPDETNAPLEDLNQPLPFDDEIVKDTLDNGLVYMIRKNSKPENRAELRLVVNAGSILENESQQGLAHFCEHMAFNGTKKFKKNELVDYLESIGMRFGPDINAYTSFDETVYMLQVPTDTAGVIEKAFQVLQDWAMHISFEADEIEKERGVVIEEWRLGRGANARIRDQQFPILFWNSRYAVRLPIGKKAVLDTFHYQTLRSFYHDWYRPDLMAVVAVGDFEVDRIRNLIIDHFSLIPAQADAPVREVFPVPTHDETLYAIASDPEARFSRIGIYHKLPVKEENTVAVYREHLIEMLYNRMFNQRLSELSKQADAPFLFASSGKGRFVRSSEVYLLNAVVKDNEIPQGLSALLIESKRIKQYGFTESELERNKASALRLMKQALEEKDKTESDRFAAEYIRHVLVQEPVPGIESEFELYKRLIPGISIQEINDLTESWITEDNRVVMASFPEKEGIIPIYKTQLMTVLDSVDDVEIQPYYDDLPDQPLISEKPQPGSILKETFIAELNITEFELQNGIKVVLKPTDFKNDEILFTAVSPGGISLSADTNLVAAQTAVSVIRDGKLGLFSREQLDKFLADKIVNVSPYIGALTEGFSGSTSPQDLETMFQLVYLYFTKAGTDSTTFESLKNRFEAFYQNRANSPESAFSDTITVTLTQNHPRYKPWTVQDLSKMNMEKSFEFFQDRFADASDFIFIFVGNFDINHIKVLIKTYLGALPDLRRDENWRDVSYSPPGNVVKKELMRGLEPKSQTSLIFTGDFTWSVHEVFRADAFIDMLRIKLREQIREELGGTYGVRISGNFSRFPRQRYQVTINYGSDPQRVQELTKAIFLQIDSLKSCELPPSYLQKVREINQREYEGNLKENNYWLDALEYRYFNDLDPRSILQIPSWIKELTLKDFQQEARKYLNESQYIQVTLYPEQQE